MNNIVNNTTTANVINTSDIATNRNIVLCGVGGQGTVLASKLLAAAAMSKDIPVMSAETIGMAQRGGSVFSHLRMGKNLYSPMIKTGTADLIIGFEPGETVRMLPYLKEHGQVVVSTHAIKPVTATLSGSSYDAPPMIDYLKKHVENLTLIDADTICRQIGSQKVLNMVLLGAAIRTGVLDFSLEEIEEVMKKTLPEKFHEMNLKALRYANQIAQVNQQIQALLNANNFYGKKLKEAGVSSIQSAEDFENLPFSEKNDLRNAYPLGLMTAPEEKIVRIHSSSGTTGLPVIIPYTAKDVDDWAIMFKRCYEMAGMTNMDRIQITPGYGLWTAGIGFQAGAEKLGAMVVPMGPGNTDKQLQMMMDMKTTVLGSTSSYALLLAEEIEKRGIKDKIHLKKGIIGSERWGEKMRNRIKRELGIEIYDIYGLTEIYGPGIGISCSHDCGMHYWDDYIYIEIIDPVTGKVLPDGELGEIVITTLVKEGAPLIRYRTHDLSRIIPGECPCGSKFPRLDTIMGRTDDMMKIKGVNVFPSQIEEILKEFSEVSSEYQIRISHLDGKDTMRIYVETNGTVDFQDLSKRIASVVKSRIGFTPLVKVVEIGLLPRSEKKTKRVIDERYE